MRGDKLDSPRLKIKAKTYNTEGKGATFVSEKKKYETASIELVYLNTGDVITTSSGMSDKEVWDQDGWD